MPANQVPFVSVHWCGTCMPVWTPAALVAPPPPPLSPTRKTGGRQARSLEESAPGRSATPRRWALLTESDNKASASNNRPKAHWNRIDVIDWDRDRQHGATNDLAFAIGSRHRNGHEEQHTSTHDWASATLALAWDGDGAGGARRAVEKRRGTGHSPCIPLTILL